MKKEQEEFTDLLSTTENQSNLNSDQDKVKLSEEKALFLVENVYANTANEKVKEE